MELILPYLGFRSWFYLSILFSFGIVLFELGTGLRAYDSHREHPYLRDQIENSGQTDLRDVKAGQVCVALYQPLMHLGWLCASTKAKDRPEMVKV
jgi:interleukin-1 receptor-associated kinase 1